MTLRVCERNLSCIQIWAKGSIGQGIVFTYWLFALKASGVLSVRCRSSVTCSYWNTIPKELPLLSIVIRYGCVDCYNDSFGFIKICMGCEFIKKKLVKEYLSPIVRVCVYHTVDRYTFILWRIFLKLSPITFGNS